MTVPAPLMLFNSMTRQLEPFTPARDNEARVYSCGPTVYNYQHIGNMRAYVFADTLGRVLRFKGYGLKHIINITDVGHLTSDADAGDDKMEKAAAAQGKSAWDIAAFYQAEFERDLSRLNVTPPHKLTKATDYIGQMIEFAKTIADKHCYEIDSGLYFDTSTVADYGRLARAVTEAGESRIEAVAGKRRPQDFAIWRKTPPGETRQMEWDSPWGKGAPGWHLECSVMSAAELDLPFDIHTGGIDHREIHHPCEIAQNQAISGCDHSGARFWMHNNFLIDRGGKMSKSAGEFLRLQTLVDKGFHPLAFRLMCLQTHYRSEMEFSWDGLQAAFVRLKRMVMGVEKLRTAAASSSREQEDVHSVVVEEFERSLDEDLNTARGLAMAEAAGGSGEHPATSYNKLLRMDEILGLNFKTLTRADLRIRPITAQITEAEIEAALTRRKEARAAKDFATSDAIRDNLIAKGVEVMDGDPLGWDWRIDV
jgi:cysteinyl-tRNA synthetase